jgi:hypothetical protein
MAWTASPMEITRQDIILAALAASPSPFTLTQVGKLLYLIDHEAGLVAPTLARADVAPAQHGVEVDAMALAMSKALLREATCRSTRFLPEDSLSPAVVRTAE